MTKDAFDKLFEDLFKDTFASSWFTSTSNKLISSEIKPEPTTTAWQKAYSSTNDETGMTLYVDLPGIDPKSVSLEVTGTNQVIVSGMNVGKTFTNRYTLSKEFDAQSATAALSHGRLSVRIRRAFTRENRKIKIDIV